MRLHDCRGCVNLFLHTMPALYARSWQVVPLGGVELWWCEPVKINTHKRESVAQQAQTTTHILSPVQRLRNPKSIRFCFSLVSQWLSMYQCCVVVSQGRMEGNSASLRRHPGAYYLSRNLLGSWSLTASPRGDHWDPGWGIWSKEIAPNSRKLENAGGTWSFSFPHFFLLLSSSKDA